MRKIGHITIARFLVLIGTIQTIAYVVHTPGRQWVLAFVASLGALAYVLLHDY